MASYEVEFGIGRGHLVIHHLHTVKFQSFRTSRTPCKFGSHLFVHFNTGLPKIFDDPQNTVRRMIKLPCRKSQLMIGDNLIGFSSSWASHNFLLEHLTRMLDVSEHLTSQTFCTCTYMATFWNVQSVKVPKRLTFGLCERCLWTQGTT